MKIIKWLITVANTRPLLFCIALLLFAIMFLGLVVINLNNSVKDCYADRADMQRGFDRRIDSIAAKSSEKEHKLNTEVKETMNKIIEYYKQQLDEQIKINERISNTINTNSKLINKTKKKIQTIDR